MGRGSFGFNNEEGPPDLASAVSAETWGESPSEQVRKEAGSRMLVAFPLSLAKE